MFHSLLLRCLPSRLDLRDAEERYELCERSKGERKKKTAKLYTHIRDIPEQLLTLGQTSTAILFYITANDLHQEPK